MANFQEKFQDSMRTVEKFRVLVQAQQDKLAAHEQKEGELSEKASALMSESRVLMVCLEVHHHFCVDCLVGSKHATASQDA
jgi:hypothetical protein